MKYEIAGGIDIYGLQKAVEHLIQKGFKPHGSMIHIPHQKWGDMCTGGTTKAEYLQPMINIYKD